MQYIKVDYHLSSLLETNSASDNIAIRELLRWKMASATWKLKA
jgi:hypothetical protein